MFITFKIAVYTCKFNNLSYSNTIFCAFDKIIGCTSVYNYCFDNSINVSHNESINKLLDNFVKFDLSYKFYQIKRNCLKIMEALN